MAMSDVLRISLTKPGWEEMKMGLEILRVSWRGVNIQQCPYLRYLGITLDSPLFEHQTKSDYKEKIGAVSYLNILSRGCLPNNRALTFVFREWICTPSVASYHPHKGSRCGSEWDLSNYNGHPKYKIHPAQYVIPPGRHRSTKCATRTKQLRSIGKKQICGIHCLLSVLAAKDSLPPSHNFQ